MTDLYGLFYFLVLLAGVLYCAAYTVYCGLMRGKGACVLAAVLTILAGGGLGLAVYSVFLL